MLLTTQIPLLLPFHVPQVIPRSTAIVQTPNVQASGTVQVPRISARRPILEAVRTVSAAFVDVAAALVVSGADSLLVECMQRRRCPRVVMEYYALSAINAIPRLRCTPVGHRALTKISRRVYAVGPIFLSEPSLSTSSPTAATCNCDGLS